MNMKEKPLEAHIDDRPVLGAYGWLGVIALVALIAAGLFAGLDSSSL